MFRTNEKRKQHRIGVEPLERRELLSGSAPKVPSAGADAAPSAPLSITLRLDPTSDPANDGTVVASSAVISGQTAPWAVVRLTGEGVPEHPQQTVADAQGQYQFQVSLGMGMTPLTAQATDASGNQASADLTVTRANQVIAWNAAALQAIRINKTPPNAARDLAILQVAVYDAVNAIDPKDASYGITVEAPRGASPDAAAAAAAHDVLVSLFPNQKAMYDAELTATLAEIPSGPDRNQGIALGTSVANRILALRSNDGSNVKVDYVPGTEVGQWVPTPPGYLPALDPQWGQVTPFALQSGSQFRPDPPPALSSSEYAAAFDEVKRLGGDGITTPTTRTPDQTQIALFWADGSGTETPPGHWNSIAEQVAVAKHDSLVKDARVFALLDIALADAAIACWDAKYTYNYWRPVTAIRNSNADGNSQTTADPSWTPLLVTPPFPSYFSGHSTFSAAAAAVLSGIYGPNTAFTTSSDALPGVTRSFSSFQAAAEEAGMSRIYGGIHYSFDNQAGLTVGQQIGNYVLQHELLPLKPGGNGRG